jgi:hypothetical protein
MGSSRIISFSNPAPLSEPKLFFDGTNGMHQQLHIDQWVRGGLTWDESGSLQVVHWENVCSLLPVMPATRMQFVR